MGLDENRAYRLSEVSEITSIPQSTLTRWARGGMIPATKFGKLWRMTGSDIRELLANGARTQETGTTAKEAKANG